MEATRGGHHEVHARLSEKVIEIRGSVVSFSAAALRIVGARRQSRAAL
jgi:hypothetical protein